MSDTISLRFAMVQGDFKGSSSSDRFSIASLSRRIPDDEFGRTYLHLAARWGTLDRIPGLNLRDPAMNLTDDQGLTVLETWHKYRYGQEAPSKSSVHIESTNRAKEIGNDGAKPPVSEDRITPPVPAHSESQGLEITKLFVDKLLSSINGNTPFPAGITKYDLVKAIPGDQAKTTFIHVAAGKGELGRFSSELVTAEMMLVKDISGRTPLHRAIKRQVFDRVPLRLCTRETLSAADNKGVSVLDLLIKNDLTGLLPESLLASISSFNEPLLIEAIRSRDFKSAPFRNVELLSSFPTAFEFDGTWYHWLGSNGHLGDVPSESLGDQVLALKDSHGRNPLHVSVAEYGMDYLPTSWKAVENFLVSDNNGRTPFHDLASLDGLGGATPKLFTREVLAIRDHDDVSVADVIEDHDQTELLPEYLRWMSRKKALLKLHELLNDDFTNAGNIWNEQLHLVINQEEFSQCRTGFVRKWSQRYTDLILDDEQAAAVAGWGSHIQVTARAGSGKTRTLVARALFHITHCRIPASSMLILAFNKKAVEEIEKRLGAFLSEEQMPHILTFHALAHRIVRPQEDLIYDQGDTKEGQVFSSTIQRIIDEEMRGGPLEKELRDLMEMQWQGDLDRIIEGGFNLQPDEFLEFRSKLPKMTIDGRRVTSEAQKHVANTLLRLGIRYSYRRTIHRYAGKAYAPDLSHYNKEKDSRIVFEVLESGTLPPNPAREAFWRSDRASNTLLIQIPEDACQDPQEVSELIRETLKGHGVTAVPMSDDELWKAVRDRAISDFSKAVKQFISRCQKELISPDQIPLMITSGIPIQKQFWRLGAKIYSSYLETLTKDQKTDFDQLMLKASEMIGDGNTRFSSSRGPGNLSSIKQVLIDEFQDFSHLFNELRKAFIAQSPEVLFFCVGDDWQAINKFAGSNLRYFTEFQNSFHPSAGNLISRNYRSCRRIAEAGNAVMSGEGSPSIANNDDPGKIHIIDPNLIQFSYSEAEEIVVEELGEHSVSVLRIVSEQTSLGLKVAILSRTGSISTPEGMLKLDRWKRKLRGFLPEQKGKLLSVSTTHGYKGKEADVVVFLGPENYPSIHPNAIFNTIFGDTFESNVADEKRLFYVGVTRAKSTLFLLRDLWDGNLSHCPPGTFLDMVPNQTRYDIGSISAHLVCVGRVVIRLDNKPGCPRDSGTFPLHNKLKSEGYKWSPENKAWSLFLEPGSISSPRECSLYLLSQPWIKEANGVVATFVWEDQRHRLVIDGGRVTPEGSPSLSPVIHDPEKKPEHSEPVDRIEQTQPKNPPASDAAGQTRQQNPVAPSAGVFETGIVGMKYGGGMEKARHLKAGDFVRLQREPGNIHDGNAIQVMTSEGARIGYVPRNVASYLAAGLDAWGGASQAKVTSVWKQPPPNFLVSIQICFPLPPDVVIPRELDASAQLEDSPFGSAKPKIRKHQIPVVTPAVPSATAEPEPTESQALPPHAATAESQQPDPEWPSNFESLSQSQRADLETLLEPRLAPQIAEMYLSGLSDWPEIGYEGKDADGICTGSMLEVAWLDFKIGIAVPTNEFRSFAEAGWAIFQADTVTASELRSQFASGTEPTTATEAISSALPNETGSDTGGGPSKREFTDTNIHTRNGQFYDEELDEDIPPF